MYSQAAADKQFDTMLVQMMQPTPVVRSFSIMWVDDTAFVVRSADGAWTKHCRGCHKPVGRCTC
jgi:hypothetical protein